MIQKKFCWNLCQSVLPTFSSGSFIVSGLIFRSLIYSEFIFVNDVQFSSVTQLCLILCDPMDHSMPGLPVHHQLWSPPKLSSIKSVMLSNHLICSHPLLFLPSIFPSIRVFSNESALHIRWRKYWSFSFNISPSNDHPRLISFRMYMI